MENINANATDPLEPKEITKRLGDVVTKLGGKQLSKKNGPKRHQKVLRDNIQGVTKPAIRRMARRGGVKRISGLVYDEVRKEIKLFLEKIIRDAITYTEHARRKTVTVTDILYALKRNGRAIYGYGMIN